MLRGILNTHKPADAVAKQQMQVLKVYLRNSNRSTAAAEF